MLNTKFLIIDIDGTVSDSSVRADKYLNVENKNWDKFYEECVDDKPVVNVCQLVDLLVANGYTPVYVTGRPERVRTQTEEWLAKNIRSFYSKDLLLMRKNHDYTPDFLYKKTRLEKELSVMGINPTNTLILEDRKSCVDMWREQGFTVLQPADGEY